MIELGDTGEADMNNTYDMSLPPYLRHLLAITLAGAAAIALIAPERQFNTAQNTSSDNSSISVSNQLHKAMNTNHSDPLSNITLHN